MRADEGVREYGALTDALNAYTPPCLGDDRYTADTIDESTRVELAAGCDVCRISALCRAYADSVRPKAGFWAGRRYSKQSGGGSR